jgi:virginiamycin B lyase
MRRSAAILAAVVISAAAGCGGPGGSVPPTHTITPPPGETGATPPPFSASEVRIAEIAVPQASPASDGPVYPSVIDVGDDGAVYFGQRNTNESSQGNFGIFKYTGGTFAQTLPAPQQGSWDGGVDAIDAHDSSTVMWSSSYQQMSEPVSFGDVMQCGASGGAATFCNFTAMSGFITSIAAAKDGTIWTAGSQCCGGGPGGYPAQLPNTAQPGMPFALDITSGPNSNVWGIVSFNGPIYEFAPNGAVLATYALPANADVTGAQAMVEGTDGALWFTDAGNNAIGRLSLTDGFTEYKLPTVNSGVQNIALAADGGMWFTEASADKIGRIDDSGKIYEFALPTPNAQPTAIAAAPANCSCPTAQVWFTETSANKIASATY